MPRVAREKSNEWIYHIMCRSNSEIDLFRDDDDMNYYLDILKKYCEMKRTSVYAYCLMTNHVHIFLDPKGFDISKFMRCLSTAYAIYYNLKYKRHGSVFQGRFASKRVESDVYSHTLTSYIHNNAKDIPGYSGREWEYPYSSYGIYLDLRKDTRQLVETEFVLGQYSNDLKHARKLLHEFTVFMKEFGTFRKEHEDIHLLAVKNEYRSEKQFIHREKEPEKLIEKICDLLGENDTTVIYAKNSREFSSIRAFCAYVLRVLCDKTYNEICGLFGNLTLPGATRLFRAGYELFRDQPAYRQIFNSLI